MSERTKDALWVAALFGGAACAGLVPPREPFIAGMLFALGMVYGLLSVDRWCKK